MNLHEFETRLEKLIGRPTELRPFVCDGSPLECHVFIVGFNPATTMDADFWDFWRPGWGFNKQAWFDAYRRDRRSRSLKPGRNRRPEVSNSRRVIEWILEAAAPVRCLETNIHAAPTDQMSDLAAERRLTAPFDFLLEAIRPKLIITHGADASRHCQQRRLDATVVAVPHFSRGWSQKAARELGHSIQHRIS